MSDRPDAFEDQDGAEALDETMLDEDDERGEMRTFEELPDVLDLTQAEGDRDDDEALALDADEFDEDAIDEDALTEEDDELDYRAATEEHEDDLDGLGDEDSFNEDALDTATSIEGLDEEVADADLVSGGEDDVSNFQAKALSDEDLERMGYSENRKGEMLAKPDD
ncbi:MAG: flaCE [Phenylobacterium sp.]|nr:flaCE [Phenylobacterium sp.]